MPWPFRKRRRSKDDPATAPPPPLAVNEKLQPPSRATTYPSTTPTAPSAAVSAPIDIPRPDSGKPRILPADKTATNKENEPPGSRASKSRRAVSREDITALPMTRTLESSPHLRPVDLDRPAIPYNFRPYSTSQTSIQRDMPLSPAPGPSKLRTRRTAPPVREHGPPSRGQSKRKKNEERLREEEIRSMSAQAPMVKRPGDGPLRRDSKKMRGSKMKDSYISLPPEDDVDSNMASISEQRGWEIGSLDIFNPRPAVRLSGAPQFVAPSSHSTVAPSPIAEMVRRDKEKASSSREKQRKRDTIGNRADDLDASDLRMLMERDAKRREKRRQERHEKLDDKLRSRNGRNRGDSDRKRRDAEEKRQADAAKQREEDERRARAIPTPPTAIHPALRPASPEQEAESAGPGIMDRQRDAAIQQSAERFETPQEEPQNPFADSAAQQVPTPIEQLPGTFSPGAYTPARTPMEGPPPTDTTRETGLATPPMSPVGSAPTAAGVAGMSAGLAGLAATLSSSADSRRASNLSPPPPITDTRRQSDPKPRAGVWANIFRRGQAGSSLRKPGEAATTEGSFSNTSRESMRNQPLPAHLVDPSQPRRISGTPTRTQSKFREDLPEMPASPPDSRHASPDVTMSTAAAAAAAARRKQRSSGPTSALPEGIISDDLEQAGSYRSDTPVSPSMRSRRIASMASVDSEGSWLASGSPKRYSTQSGLNRSIGSLNQRFTGSYEELGADRDAEHFNRGVASASPDKRTKLSSTALSGAPDEETDEDDDGSDDPVPSGDPLTMREGVRRRPTLVHRDPKFKSREGLLTEYSAAASEPTLTTSGPVHTGGDAEEPTSALSRDSMDFDDEHNDEPVLQRASSVEYRGHIRQISAGSARLMEIGPRSPGARSRDDMLKSLSTDRVADQI